MTIIQRTLFMCCRGRGSCFLLSHF